MSTALWEAAAGSAIAGAAPRGRQHGYRLFPQADGGKERVGHVPDVTGAPVNIKVEGKLYPLGSAPAARRHGQEDRLFADGRGQVPQFERDLELNMAIAVKEAGRFRVNVFKQRGEVGMVIRAIKSDIPSIDQLKLPQVLKDIIMEPRGLVLVVGSTGSGKSTTLAAMIDHRNSTSTGHILTIEDPIEFLHRHKKSIVNQREVGLDTHSFHAALKNAMREAPDVILIGEIRDQATMEAAIAFAETGHLCLATLHSNNADQTIERILNFFPEGAHKNILMNLSLNLKAVVSAAPGGRQGRQAPAGDRGPDQHAGDPRHDAPRAGARDQGGDGQSRWKKACRPSTRPVPAVQGRQGSRLEEALRKADSRDGLALKIRLSEGGGGEHDPYADVFGSPADAGQLRLTHPRHGGTRASSRPGHACAGASGWCSGRACIERRQARQASRSARWSDTASCPRRSGARCRPAASGSSRPSPGMSPSQKIAGRRVVGQHRLDAGEAFAIQCRIQSSRSALRHVPLLLAGTAARAGC
jgi:twitching motility protein PilU